MILVTGGTGFVGPRIVHALRARELPVRALVRDPGRAESLRNWGCELVQGDVTDQDSVRRALRGCDRVVHLVAIRRGTPEDFERVMCQATRDLAAAAQAAGVDRFVLMSALGTNERTKNLVPYYHCKWEMERAVEGAGLEYVIFRPSFVFGPGGGALKLFARVAKAPVTAIVGSGKQRMQPIWIEDVAQYFAQAVDKPEAANRMFELGGPDVVTWDELYDRLKRTLGKRRPTIHLPVGFMRFQAAILEKLPGPTPITRDEVAMIEAGDNVVTNDEARRAFPEIDLLPLDEQLRRATA